MDKNIKKELVISLYDKDIEWINKLDDDVKITIYRKGDILSHDNEIVMDNVGRDVHTFFKHLVDRYEYLSDYTFFSQDYPFDHIQNYIEIINGDESTWNKYAQCKFGGYWGYHWNSIGTMHRMYPSVKFNGNVLYSRLDGKPHHHEYLPIGEYWQKLFTTEMPLEFEFIPAGHFTISKTQVHTRPLNFYKKIVSLLETDEIAPWVIERLELYIFNTKFEIKE